MASSRHRISFWQQKSNAKRRGIIFKLTFDEWFDIWSRSGCFKKRGRGLGKYCMARFNDKGAYEVGNVKIMLFGENTGEQEWTQERRNFVSRQFKGKKRPPRSKIWRKRLSEAQKKYKHTDEHRKAISFGTTGEKNPSAKLTETNVLKIRNSYKYRSPSNSFVALARKYDVTPALIRQIVTRRIWKHI